MCGIGRLRGGRALNAECHWDGHHRHMMTTDVADRQAVAGSLAVDIDTCRLVTPWVLRETGYVAHRE